VHAAEHDEFGVRAGCCFSGQLEGVAGDVGKLDDLVPLVVVTEDEQPVAQGRFGPPGPLDQGWIGRRRQIARTLDTTLGSRVGLLPENEQRQRRPGAERRGRGRARHATNVLTARAAPDFPTVCKPIAPTFSDRVHWATANRGQNRLCGS
jgi:hypothetical protein